MCVLIPAASAALIALLPLPRRAQGMVGAGSIALAFVAAVLIALERGFGGGPFTTATNFVIGTWASGGGFTIPLGFWVDGLSLVFALVITGVGFLIHVYSLSYMHAESDADYGRYFASMNVFVAAMLLLVLADGYGLLIVGWAGVGFASYLLIGFWHDRPAAVAAARKAFILNTIGDIGLILAVALLVLHTGGADFQTLFARGAVARLAGSPTAAVWIGLFLFLAAAAKSAQLPLQSWLSDAMEGPTPVSALIHAATMVTAGVYLIARSSPIFAAAPGAAATAGYLGAATALMAALMGVAGYDLKRVLAFSTMSQVGYMIAAVSFGALAAGTSHVVTHAFFKALLFMSAGIVMHVTGDERDMRRYGGLAAAVPAARWGFLIGALALSGIPPFSGFFSKDAVMGALLHTHTFAYILLAVTALLTPFYIFRAYYLTFAGNRRGEVDSTHAEIALSMRWPTWTLAVLATFGGVLALLLQSGWGVAYDWTSAAISTVLGLAGWAAAWQLYRTGDLAVDGWATGAIGQWLRKEYGWEAAWHAAVVEPAHALAGWLQSGVEGTAWPGAQRGIAAGARWLGDRLGGWQSGLVRQYALSMFCAVALVLAYAIARGH